MTENIVEVEGGVRLYGRFNIVQVAGRHIKEVLEVGVDIQRESFGRGDGWMVG